MAQLDSKAQGKAASVRDFLELEDPTREFRQAMKAKEELEEALKERIGTKNATISELQKQVMDYKDEIQHLKTQNLILSDMASSAKVLTSSIVSGNANGLEGHQNPNANGENFPSPEKRSTNSPDSVSPVLTSIERKPM